jgi:hypothetical protein
MTAIAPAEEQVTQAGVPPTRSQRSRFAWTLGGLLLAAAIVPAVALSIIGSTAYQRLNSRERVFTTPVTAVSVQVSSGDITIGRGSGGNTVVATSGVHGLTYPSDDEHVVGHTLVIRSSCGAMIFNDRCSRSYVVSLPSGVAVIADSSQGNVIVRGADRTVSAHSGQGDVTITRGSGTLQASSGQGDVSITGSAATSVSVHSGQGDVAVDLISPPKRLTASSGQGDVTIELPKGSNYNVQANSGQGDVSDSVDNNPASDRVVNATSGQGDVTVSYRHG